MLTVENARLDERVKASEVRADELREELKTFAQAIPVLKQTGKDQPDFKQNG